jgi:hypothetical protein
LEYFCNQLTFTISRTNSTVLSNTPLEYDLNPYMKMAGYIWIVQDLPPHKIFQLGAISGKIPVTDNSFCSSVIPSTTGIRKLSKE